MLPSLDFDIGLTDTLKARLSYSKTIARAQYDQLRAAINVGGFSGPTITGGIPSANVSNPALVPLESDNIDMSLEWYFGESSYLSAGVFEKRVSNFIGTEQVGESFFGLRDVTSGPRALAARDAVLAITDPTIRDVGAPVNETELFVMAAILEHPEAFPNGAADFAGNSDPAQAVFVATTYDIVPNASDPLYEFQTTRPINNKEAKLYGVELAGQHFFGESGFGLQANYTIVRGDIGFNDNGDPGVNQFALLGFPTRPTWLPCTRSSACRCDSLTTGATNTSRRRIAVRAGAPSTWRTIRRSTSAWVRPDRQPCVVVRGAEPDGRRHSHAWPLGTPGVELRRAGTSLCARRALQVLSRSFSRRDARDGERPLNKRPFSFTAMLCHKSGGSMTRHVPLNNVDTKACA